jgi:hypothetical protein
LSFDRWPWQLADAGLATLAERQGGGDRVEGFGGDRDADHTQDRRGPFMALGLRCAAFGRPPAGREVYSSCIKSVGYIAFTLSARVFRLSENL